jgi:hypothetical protein
METLWKSVIELSGKSRVVNSLVPTAIFLVGLGALVIDVQFGWQSTIQWWQALKAETQLIFAVVGILLVIAVAAPFDAFTPMFLRWAEGYWGNKPLLRWLDKRQRAHHRKIIEESQAQFSALRDRQDKGTLSPSELHCVQQLDLLLHSYPPDPQRAMPTFLGNVIRAAEDHARVRYGLDPIVAWVRVYSSINITIQEAIETDQTALDLTVRITTQTLCFAIIGILFMIISGKWLMGLLVLVVGWAVAYLAYQAAIQTAKSYSELIRAVFDLYRFDLYQSLHLPLPTQNGDAERKQGDILTRLLWRGDVVVRYEHRKETKDGAHVPEL